MRRISLMALAAVAAATSIGCATMANGTRQAVALTSEPSGAHVYVNGKPAGMTPLRLDLKRRQKETVLRVAIDGFLPREVRLERSFSGWTAGNLVLANPYAGQGTSSPPKYSTQLLATASGFGLDLLTGAAFQFPATVKVTLEPGPRAPGPRH